MSRGERLVFEGRGGQVHSTTSTFTCTALKGRHYFTRRSASSGEQLTTMRAFVSWQLVEEPKCHSSTDWQFFGALFLVLPSTSL